MSNTYHALIDNEAKGPFTMEELYRLESSGQINESSALKPENSEQWVYWKSVKPALALTAGEMALHISVARGELQKITAYSFLRSFGNWWVGLTCLLATVFWLLALIGVATEIIPTLAWILLAIATTLSIPVTIIANGVVQAMLDIADIHLLNRKQL